MPKASMQGCLPMACTTVHCVPQVMREALHGNEVRLHTGTVIWRQKSRGRTSAG